MPKKEKLTDVAILVPLQVISEANSRDHWRTRNRRATQQKNWVKIALGTKAKAGSFQLPAVVFLTRYGARLLDSDNLANAFKAIRDQVAAWLGCGDSPKDPVVWEYSQYTLKALKGIPEAASWKHAIRIEIKSTTPQESNVK